MAHETWKDTMAAAIPTLRAAYLAEVGRLAAELRPRLESGELGDFRDPDGDSTARDALEAACAARFGCGATKDEEGAYTGDDDAALSVLLASPSGGDEVDAGFFHIGQPAQSAVALDVLTIARARGWVKP